MFVSLERPEHSAGATETKPASLNSPTAGATPCRCSRTGTSFTLGPSISMTQSAKRHVSPSLSFDSAEVTADCTTLLSDVPSLDPKCGPRGLVEPGCAHL